MDYGVFLLFGCVVLALLVSLPVTILAYIQKSPKLRRHVFCVVALAAVLLAMGLFIRQAYFLDEPLASAASEGDIKEVQLLLAQGASPNAEGVDGMTTALIAASANGHAHIVQVLLAKGADVNQTDAGGRTALQRAVQEDHKDVVQMLKKAGAR